MSIPKITKGIGNIDDDLVSDAVIYKGSRNNRWWIKYAAVAACFVIAVFTTLSIEFSNLPQTEMASTGESQNSVINPTNSVVNISLQNIFLNEILDEPDTARRWYDPSMYEDVKWDQTAIDNYYETDLVPPYIPDGLFASPLNGTTTVKVDKKGNIVLDSVWLNFYHDYYEDGSPKLNGDILALKGISVRVSKLGILDCFDYMSGNEVKISDISGIPVTFGHHSLPYGPYDPDTHKPSGYYDMYVAEFEKEGIDYQIVSEQVELEEFVKFVSSIVCEKVIEIEE